MSQMAQVKHAAAPAADNSVKALINLHMSSLDTLRGFEKMVDKAEPAFLAVVQRFAALHLRQVVRMDAMVREMGGVPDQNGSFIGSLNRAIVGLLAVFNAVDEDTMDQVRSGERHVLAAFDRALMCSLPQGHRQALTQMRADLAKLLADTRNVN